MDRRSFLAGGLLAALMPGSGQGMEESLRSLGHARGIDIGTAIGETASLRQLDLINAHCTLITPEWQLKPRFLKRSAGATYNFAPADEIARLATTNGQKLHGHSLYWEQQGIAWAQAGDLDMVKRLYGGFIRDVVARYPVATSWDVFNEIIPHPGAVKNATTIERLGPDFVDFCFRIAHEAAPSAKLALNDHSLECAGDWCGYKQANALRMLEALLKRGTPIHALGLQAHLSSEWIPWARSTANFIRAVGDLGIEVYLSELDVDDSRFPANPAARDRQVAAYYRDFLGPVLERKAVKRVVFWGMSDAGHWMVRGKSATSRRPRPALFDENDDPKPAFEAVRLALAQSPAR